MKTVVATCVLKKVWGRGYKRIACKVCVNTDCDEIDFVDNEGRIVEWLNNTFDVNEDNLVWAFADKNAMYRKGWFISEYESTEPSIDSVPSPCVKVIANTSYWVIYSIEGKKMVYIYTWGKTSEGVFTVDIVKRNCWRKQHDFKNYEAWCKSLNNRIAKGAK